MSQAVAGHETIHRFNAYLPSRLPATAADINVVSTVVSLGRGTTPATVQVSDAIIEVAVNYPADSAGMDTDIAVVAIVAGVEQTFTANLGIVGVDIAARMDAQDACLAEIKESVKGANGDGFSIC